MQSQSIQTWRGCSETISLARITPSEAPVQTAELSEQSPLRAGVPSTEGVARWKPGTAEEVNIVTIEEPGLSRPSQAAVHARDYAVVEAVSGIGMRADLRPCCRSARELWNTPTQVQEVEPEVLRVSPDAPTEVKYRIWIQPTDESARHQLGSAGERPCPAVKMPGLEALTTALEHSTHTVDAALPGVEGFAGQGLVARAGTSLQSVLAIGAAEPFHVLYPGSPRLPIAATGPED
jgi:hypothetical protein